MNAVLGLKESCDTADIGLCLTELNEAGFEDRVMNAVLGLKELHVA